MWCEARGVGGLPWEGLLLPLTPYISPVSLFSSYCNPLVSLITGYTAVLLGAALGLTSCTDWVESRVPHLNPHGPCQHGWYSQCLGRCLGRAAWAQLEPVAAMLVGYSPCSTREAGAFFGLLASKPTGCFHYTC